MQRAHLATGYEQSFRYRGQASVDNAEQDLDEVLVRFTAAEEELIKLISKGHDCASLTETLGRDPKSILVLLSSIIEKRSAKAME